MIREALSILWVWSSSKKNNRNIRPLIVLVLISNATIRNGLLHFPPSPPSPKIHPLKNVFHVPPQFPPSLLSFLKKCQIGMTTACRPLATLFEQKGQTREKIPHPPPYIFSERKGRTPNHTFLLFLYYNYYYCALVEAERSSSKGRCPPLLIKKGITP